MFGTLLQHTASAAVHRFDNGIQVFDKHLNAPQRERYRASNVHEVAEEPIFLGIVDALPGQAVFVALGSAIGYYALLARKRAPELVIHSFEPLPMHREYMRENIALNGMDPVALPIHPEAVAEHDGETWLVEESYSSALQRDVPLETRIKDSAKRALYRLGIQTFQPTRRLAVPALSLDSIVWRVGGRIDLLQMDVQGLEIDALRGGSRSLAAGACGTLLVSTHGPGVHAACRDLLVQHGYRIDHDDPCPPGQPDGMLVAGRT